MIKYMIIDDEFMAHSIIREYCDLLPNMQFEKSCEDAIESLTYLKSHQVDLIFLDLNMPKLKGFDFLRTLQYPPKVIVTTAFREYALEGYELNVTDYLLKPFSFERFLLAVNKVILAAPSGPIEIHPSKEKQRIFLYSDKKYIQVYIDDITHIESSGNYCKVFHQDNIITIRQKISVLVDLLPSNEFSQVHKSFIIGHRHINKIESVRITIGDQKIPIGKLYRSNVKALIEK